MATYLTLDSSVFIAALREDEKYHRESLELLKNVKDGKYLAIEPFSVLVEIVAAIKRRTGSRELALRVKKDILEIKTINFFDIDRISCEKACEIAAESGVRGMDAIVIQIALEQDAILVSLDTEMLEKAKHLVKGRGIKEILKI